MESQSSQSLGSRAEPWIALALCAAVLLAGAWGNSFQPAGHPAFAPDWLPLAAAGFAAAGIMRLDGSPRWLRVQRALRWTGLLLMVWAANGLPFDLLTAAGLMGHRTASGASSNSASTGRGWRLGRWLSPPPSCSRVSPWRARPPLHPPGAATWYGYAAFVLALPYPVLRMHWALGGTLGLIGPARPARASPHC